jgi:glycosyltransferase involved in cell wall biosynthesis
VRAHSTLGRGRLRIPYKLIGSNRALALHDYVVSHKIEALAGQIDIVHTWPLGAFRTLKTARKLGIPSILERPNAHTGFAMEVVKAECERLGITLPPNHEHAYNARKLEKENEEYHLATKLVCPSEFVRNTFLALGFPPDKLVRHQYGFDEKVYHPEGRRESVGGLRMLFAGGCAPRKGLHYALHAWLNSTAHREGTFSIAGEFVPGYAEKLSPMLVHPSVRVLGYRRDVPELMRNSDVLVLPSLEEGSALVTLEARGSGCVLLVSDAAGAICRHMENALVHKTGDVQSLARHITILDEDRTLLRNLKSASLDTAGTITWSVAGIRLLNVYREVVGQYTSEPNGAHGRVRSGSFQAG